MTLVLDPAALEGLLPHRGPNMLPDVVEVTGKCALSRTRIPVGDVRGREIFGRKTADGLFWNEPFLAELMALTGIPLLTEGLAAKNQVAVFSMISKLIFHRPAPLGAMITGHAEVTRERSGFTTFLTRAEVDGLPLLEAEVMSGAATMAEISNFPVRPFPTVPTGTPALAMSGKPAPLRFADAVVKVDGSTVIVAYTYPTDHPFVPGHFPGAPLMMGVTQWSAVADAAWLAAKALGRTGKVVVSGGINRPDGSPVMDVRDLEIAVDDAGPAILTTKRIAFREAVRPGDGLLITVTLQG